MPLPTDPRLQTVVVANLIRMGWGRLRSQRSGGSSGWVKIYPPLADLPPGKQRSGGWRIIAREGGPIWEADLRRALSLARTRGNGLTGDSDRRDSRYTWRPPLPPLP